MVVQDMFFFLIILLSLTSCSRKSPVAHHTMVSSLLGPILLRNHRRLIHFSERRRDVKALARSSTPHTLHFVYEGIDRGGVIVSRIHAAYSYTASRISNTRVSPNNRYIVALACRPEGRPKATSISTFICLGKCSDQPITHLHIANRILPNASR